MNSFFKLRIILVLFTCTIKVSASDKGNITDSSINQELYLYLKIYKSDICDSPNSNSYFYYFISNKWFKTMEEAQKKGRSSDTTYYLNLGNDFASLKLLYPEYPDGLTQFDYSILPNKRKFSYRKNGYYYCIYKIDASFITNRIPRIVLLQNVNTDYVNINNDMNCISIIYDYTIQPTVKKEH